MRKRRGFSVRVARSLSRVLKEAPWKGGYDLSIGTSKEVGRGLAEWVGGQGSAGSALHWVAAHELRAQDLHEWGLLALNSQQQLGGMLPLCTGQAASRKSQACSCTHTITCMDCARPSSRAGCEPGGG